MSDATREAIDAMRNMTAALIAVSGHLDTPYPDDPRWTPWTRFVKPGLDRMERARASLRAENDGAARSG